ncbi:hypothetical protein BK798_00180 [Methanobrevibacter smithii]|uniref:Acyltransferase 3 domain-containing protein n=1 Tax=Methanobrevibacter smithii TaxID=2173 RepID=A0A2H4U493_METSM|nr:acyltransferase [Methanobrevibacter smithii]ATZ58935.1 hypothetical protein BK798_00180 [Methanobrevibacter smithii]
MEISGRIRYVDQLRAVSILFLIAINVAMVFKYKSVGNLQEYVVFTTFGFGVPIFLMLLGLLMLDRDYSDIETFIKTDFVRIFIPFLIWNTLLALLMTASAGKLSFSFSCVVYFMSKFMTQHWYAWMLLGLYLSLPIFSPYVRSTKLRGAKYFLILAISASLIYQLIAYIGSPTYFNLTFFIGPILYMFLGYYLENHRFNIKSKWLILLGFVIFLITTAYMINFDIFVNGIQKTIFLHHYNFLTENYVDVSVVAILQAAGVFVMIKYLNDSKLQNNKILKRIHNSRKFNYSVMTISRVCYGVYLLNQSLLLILTTFVDISFLDNPVGIVVLTFVLAFVCCAIILGLIEMGVPGKYIGYD